MKNNRLIYLLLIILAIWCLTLTSIVSNNSDTTNETINEINVTGFSTDFTKIVDNHKDSIVSISSNGTVSSGFIYAQDNNKVYIVTSYHGLADASSYLVYFENNYNINANLIGFNIYSDIAVLEANIPYTVETMLLGDVTSLKAGEFIVAIGTPVSLEYSNSVELGMISNKCRTIENSISISDDDIKYYIDVVQLTSNLKPGYSGSPIINMNGEVVGMITMQANEKINFALTANEIRIIVDNIIDGNKVKKHQLGIKGTYICDMPLYVRTNLNLSIDTITGLYVNKIMDNSIGMNAGLKTGDVILSINGTLMNNIDDYLSVVYSENDSFEFEVLRNGEAYICKAEIND